MRRGLIIAIVGGVPEVISGPAVPYGEQRLRFKQLRSDHPESFEGAELWDSSNGRVKRVRFKPGTGNEDDEVEFQDDELVFLTAEEREIIEQYRAVKAEIAHNEALTNLAKAELEATSAAPGIQFPKEEQPSVLGAVDAPGQSALPAPEVVIETEAKIVGGSVALVEVPTANAPGIGTTTGPALEGQVADEDDGPTLDLPSAAKPEAEKPAAKSHTSKTKKH